MIDTDILIVGAGAIGGVIAAHLQHTVRSLSVLDANREHVARLRNPGLLLDDLGVSRAVVLDAHSDANTLPGTFEFALLTVKSPYLRSAIESIRDRQLARTYVCLGNGLVQEQVADLVGRDRFMVGIVEWGATNLGTGRVARTTTGPFVLGEPDGTERGRTRRLAQALKAVSAVRVSSNIHGQVWSKLLVNSTFSGLGAVSGLLYDQIVERGAGRHVALRLWNEGLTVAEALGIQLDEVLGIAPHDLRVTASGDPSGAHRALSVMMERVGPTKASMLQDIERGVPTEVGVINGAVLEQGARLGLATPMNAYVVDMVHAIERGSRQPAPQVLEELAALSGGSAPYW